MHTYKRTRDGDSHLWVVGHYQITCDEQGPSWQEWRSMKDFNTEAEAAAYVSYLNGGQR